jgi:hypothetical protein
MAQEGAPRLEAAFLEFPGPLLDHGRMAAWSLPIAERVRSEFIDLALLIGSRREQAGDAKGARAAYLRALEFYLDATEIFQALIRERLSRNDAAGAMEHYARYERTLRASGETVPSPAIRALVQPFMKPPDARLRA